MAMILPNEWPKSIGLSFFALTSRMEMKTSTTWGMEGGDLKELNPDPGKSNLSIVY